MHQDEEKIKIYIDEIEGDNMAGLNIAGELGEKFANFLKKKKGLKKGKLREKVIPKKTRSNIKKRRNLMEQIQRGN